MIHPHTEIKFINDIVGYGVVATQFIPKGTITWVKDKLDRTFSPSEVGEFDEIYKGILEKYCYVDNKGSYVLCWDISRFVNHSFNSNCFSTAYEFEIAVRDIHPGEELTDDYGYLNVKEPFECIQEHGSERTHVLPDDLLKYHPIWDKKIKEGFQFFNDVEQPLIKLLPQEIVVKAKNIGHKKEELESILNCYFDRNKKH
ncbi:MAG: SET domain-containing protein [Bacteroidetes bacterium]|nr:SET domain-containing protein [Bacteroidota bacterium]HET6245522.1 SET domain-containing protein [Bacteroidia bacterium]